MNAHCPRATWRALLVSLITVLALAAWGCSDDGQITKDGKVTKDGSTEGGATVDSRPSGLPPDYRPWACKHVGMACNAHDPCAVNAVCGADKKCWPQFLQDCSDGQDCTVDSCLGQGLCSNEPKAGWCVLGFTSTSGDGGADGGIDTGTTPSSTFKCVAKGTVNPSDPCLACNPTESDAGATNNTKWMPISGGKCDDGNACTKNDTCVYGICKGTYYGNLCADNYGCTTDLCNGIGGCLGNTLKKDWCLINKVCYKDGGKHPSGSCNKCNVAVSQSVWTPITNSCHINGKCYDKGDPHTGKCAQCDPAVSKTAWSVPGSNCLINNVCKKPGDKDPTGCLICDPTRNRYGWSTIANLCKIYGKCYKKGDQHPGKCAECVPATSNTAWTVTTSNCLINNVCYKPGNKDAINCSTCDPTKDKYGWSPIAGLCKISGACYKKGDKHPGKCAECDTAVSSTAWTVKGNECLIYNVCKKPGDKDLSGCSACDPNTSRYNWTALSGLCKIDGKCYAKGAKHSGGCAECSPTLTTTSWTVTGNQCLIDLKCYNSGAKHTTGAGVCDPNKDKYDWTVSGNTCLIGSTNRSNGALEPGGCGVCNPAKSKTSWTKASGCLITHAWSKKFGSTSSDYPYGMAVDGNGNVYITGYFYNSINFGGVTHTSKGSVDIFIASFTPSGKYRWSKTFGSSSSDYGYDVAVDGNGNVTLSGSFRYSINFGGTTLTSNGSSNDIFIASFDSGGKHRWSKSFGNTSSDYGYAVAADSSGNVYMTGYFYNSVNFGGSTLYSSGSYDIYLVSFDTNGKHRWSKNFGNTSSDYGYGVAVDGSGNVYITGYFYNSVTFGGSTLTSKGSGDIFLASFTSAGIHRWSKSFGGTSSDYGYDIAVDNSANVYITGFFYTSADFGGGTLTSKGYGDIFLASYTTGGTHRWSKNFGGTNYDYGWGVGVDNSGNSYITGYYYYSVNFGGSTFTSKGSYDSFIASFNSAGAHRWSRSHGSTSSDQGRRIAVAGNGDVFTTGYFYYTVDFGGGPLTASSYDIYLLKLAP